MHTIDIYEMIEDQLNQPPYNLLRPQVRMEVLVYDLVDHIPPHVFARALREIAALTDLRLDDGHDVDIAGLVLDKSDV